MTTVIISVAGDEGKAAAGQKCLPQFYDI